MIQYMTIYACHVLLVQTKTTSARALNVLFIVKKSNIFSIPLFDSPQAQKDTQKVALFPLQIIFFRWESRIYDFMPTVLFSSFHIQSPLFGYYFSYFFLWEVGTSDICTLKVLTHDAPIHHSLFKHIQRHSAIILY